MSAQPPSAGMQQLAAERKAARAAATGRRFDELPEKLNFVAMEEANMAYWKRIDAFKTSLAKSQGRPRYMFYDGPPFATGLPHYGHMLAGTIKDVVCRYAHQTGHHVERRFGWDCHGLPIEFEIEKQLGIKSSHDVRELGIKNYNKACRDIVMRYANEWEEIVTRSGRWIDFENDYKTMNLPFMESVWWVFSELWRKGLVYRDFRVMPYSTGCTTPLSNFECNLNYKDTTDPSCMVTFPLIPVATADAAGSTTAAAAAAAAPAAAEEEHLVAWTTTPWTLPSNLALCVNAEFVYARVRDAKTQKIYIVAECRLEEVYPNHAKAKEAPFLKLGSVIGKELVGRQYKPLFPYFEFMRETGAFRVCSDAYVKADAGTGVVHCAPFFGEEDHRVCKAHNIFPRGAVACPIDENGCFTAQVPDFQRRYVKDCDNDILAAIKAAGRLHSKASIVHSYPFCWRSETPLLYRAVEAWFVNVEKFKGQLLETNRESMWVPDFVQTKRFSNWLEDARDWNVSRNRYWGTPLPVWHSEDWEEVVCVGSVAELEKLTGAAAGSITDIHREFVDDITIPSKRPGKPPLKRVSMVFDCWFESGSMPYGQLHYPFENKELFEQVFPADFIAEGLDQTRGWFYTLLVLSTALFGKSPFKNLVVNGLVLAADGKKMSKRLKNYPEVSVILNNYGADSLRLYLINSPVVRAESLRFREEGVKEIVRDVFIPLANAMKFFTANANHFLETRKPGSPLAFGLEQQSTNLMDRWIVAASQSLVQFVRQEMAAYRLYTVVPEVLRFVDILTNWYVRMNRRRLKGVEESDTDWEMALSTLFQVLYTVSRVLAPFTPFLAESFYQCLRPMLPAADGATAAEESVHYVMVPDVDTSRFDKGLERAMKRLISVIDLVRVMREREGIPIKMPVKQVMVVTSDAAYLDDLRVVAEYIKQEINAVDLSLIREEDDFVTTKLDANFAALGKRFKKEVKDIAAALKAMSTSQVKAFVAANGGKVAGFELTMDDVQLKRETKPLPNFECNGDGEVVVLLDKRRDAALKDSYLAREFVTRVQQLRKRAGLVISDVVDVYVTTTDAEVAGAIERSHDQIAQTIRSGKWTVGAAPATGTVLATDNTEIGEAEITVVLVKARHVDPAAA